MSFILPDGVAQLRTTGAVLSDLTQQQRDASNGIFGISGTLTADNYAHADRREMLRSAKEFAAAIRQCRANNGNFGIGGDITQNFLDIQVWMKLQDADCILVMVVQAKKSNRETVLLGFNPETGR